MGVAAALYLLSTGAKLQLYSLDAIAREIGGCPEGRRAPLALGFQ